MKKILQLSTLLTALSLSTPTPAAEEAKMSCRKAYGNSVFNSFDIQFTAEDRLSTPYASSQRKVSMVLTYERSDLDSAKFAPSFTAESTVYKIVHGEFSFHIDDLHDYAAATLSFDYRDDQLGPMAVMQYSSDGMDAFAVFQCDQLPPFTW